MPMTYAGRLDPMAEGLLLVLSGEAIKEKEKYTSLSKTYEFEMLWGVETDTADVLGLINQPSIQQEEPCQELTEKSSVDTALKSAVGNFQQKYPAYSSRTVGGKSLIEWSRAGKIGEVEIPSHEVELMSAVFISRRELSGAELLKNVEEKISLVRGDFRQESILSAWRAFLTPRGETVFTLDRVRVDVSGGFYVRQFVTDVARSLGTCATTYHIVRTRIGDFHEPTTTLDLH